MIKVEKCPACAAIVTKGIGSKIADLKKHIAKCAEHERRWVAEGKMVFGQPVPTPHLDYLNEHPLKSVPMKKELPELPKEVRVKETIGFTLNGVTVFTVIDYNRREVSLVEKDGQNKQWLFAKRTPDYFNGWRGILAAMNYAIDQAEKRLAAQPSMLEQVLLAEAIGGGKK